MAYKRAEFVRKIRNCQLAFAPERAMSLKQKNPAESPTGFFFSIVLT
jgi:hypothetical protein